MTKREIARVLNEIAFFLRLREENVYRSRAYERAGRALLVCPEDPRQLVDSGRLTEVKGIGPGTASVITELMSTGASTLHQTVKGSYPSSLVELGAVPRLGPKQIRRLYDQAGIQSVAELQVACRNNQLLALKGIGPRVQAKVQAALGEFQRGQGYRLYANVLEEAYSLEKGLTKIRGVGTVTVAGDLRRKMEVINAYHFVIGWEENDMARFLDGLEATPNITGVLMTHKNTVSAISPTDLPLTITLAPRKHYDFYLLQATGSEEHLRQLLTHFAAQGLHNWEAVRARFKGSSEEAIYRAAGLPFVPAELREGRDEFEIIKRNGSARLIEPSQIQGFFHLHTDYSDGDGTVEEMVIAARDRGYTYIGISDHSQSAFYANGLKEPQIRKQWAEIDAVQQKYKDIHVFKGIEADILPDGSMDYPDHLLAEFDFVIASVHSRFNLSEADQTRRVCRALANPYVTMLGHPTGRLLLSRPGYRVDLTQVVNAAVTHRKVLEINGSRHRLDLDWRFVRFAKAQDVKFSINPDAHAVEELRNVSFGVNVARKGGLDTQDVVNTKTLSEMKAFLSHMRMGTNLR